MSAISCYFSPLFLVACCGAATAFAFAGIGRPPIEYASSSADPPEMISNKVFAPYHVIFQGQKPVLPGLPWEVDQVSEGQLLSIALQEAEQ